MVQVLQGQHIREPAVEPLAADDRVATQSLALSVAAVVLLSAAVTTVVAGDAPPLVAVVVLLLSFVSATVGIVLGHVAWRTARRRHDMPFGRTVAALVVGYVVAVPGWLVLVSLVADLAA